MGKSLRRPPKRAREILRHYLENPATTDSLEGIARWRLLEETVEVRVREIREALRWLVDQGYLERMAPHATVPLYRLKSARKIDGATLMTARDRTPRGSRRCRSM